VQQSTAIQPQSGAGASLVKLHAALEKFAPQFA